MPKLGKGLGIGFVDSIIPTPSPSITPTLTPTVTRTPTLTPTISITPTRTQTPTITVTPTITKTPTSTPALAPSGIPVASTERVVVTNSSNGFDGTYVKNADQNRYEIDFGFAIRIIYWKLNSNWAIYYTNYDNEYEEDCGAPSQNQNYIPTTGWNFTITADSPTPTPTNTPTISITPTNTQTPTRTQTPTITLTPTISITPTRTQTPTPSITPTQTKTQTPTPTVTRTVTPTPSITPTNTVTPTVTRSYDPNAIYTGVNRIVVTGATGSAAFEINGTYDLQYYNYPYAVYSKSGYSDFTLSYENSDRWAFGGSSDSGFFERAYFIWNDPTIIPSTTGWVKGDYGYGNQSDYNNIIIQKET